MNIIDTTGLTDEEVFALRGYGASETAGIMGLGYKSQTRYKIFLRHAFGIKEDFDEVTLEKFRWGHRLEDDIAEEFEFQTGMKFAAHQVLVAHPDHPWMTALIDGVTECGKIVDYKAMGSRSGYDLEDGDVDSLEPRHIIQAQHQMSVCEKGEAGWGCFADMRLFKFWIPRDDEMIELIIQLLKEFKELVDTLVPPTEFAAADLEMFKKLYRDVDGEALDFTDDFDLDAIAARLVEAKQAESYAKDEIDKLKAQLLEVMATSATAELMNHTLERKNRHRKGYTAQPSDYVELICKSKFSTKPKRKVKR